MNYSARKISLIGHKCVETLSTEKCTNFKSPTVAIGGVGGSGTRVVAQILSDTGLQIGPDLNAQNDNLLFTFLFRRPELFSSSEGVFEFRFNLFKKLISGNAKLSSDELALLDSLRTQSLFQYDLAWVDQRLSFLKNTSTDSSKNKTWGWKEPNTHLFIDKILKLEPTIKYLHIMRSGLDMAYSNNQNQLMLWGQYFLENPFAFRPPNSLKYWRLVHERMNAILENNRSSVYIVNFDELCRSPKDELTKMFEFLSFPVTDEELSRHCSLIRVPKSIGRHEQHSLIDFDKCDIEFCRKMGY